MYTVYVQHKQYKFFTDMYFLFIYRFSLFKLNRTNKKPKIMKVVKMQMTLIAPIVSRRMYTEVFENIWNTFWMHLYLYFNIISYPYKSVIIINLLVREQFIVACNVLCSDVAIYIIVYLYNMTVSYLEYSLSNIYCWKYLRVYHIIHFSGSHMFSFLIWNRNSYY